MTVTIDLSESMVNALQAEAKSRGLTVDAYLAHLAEQATVKRDPSALSVEEFEAALDELLQEDAQELPSTTSTYSREDVYVDHD